MALSRAGLCGLGVFSLALLKPLPSLAQTPQAQAPIWAGKPDVAAFEKLEEERLQTAQSAISALLAVKGPRTLENTLAPYDRAVERIDAAAYLASVVENVHPDAAFRDRATAMVEKASAANTAVSLNRDVYQALASLDLAKADLATRHYVERQLLEFRLAGVNQDDSGRARLKEWNDKLTEAQSLFNRNISDDLKSVVVDRPEELFGLPQDFIDGHKPAQDGKIHISVAYPDFFPVMTFAKSDDLRKRLMAAFDNRGFPMNRDVLQSMRHVRHEMAALLGYKSWADWNAADKMIGNGGKIEEFVAQLDEATKEPALREFQMLLAEKQKTHKGATELWDYESAYYRELLRRSTYDFDSQSVRPYFPYARVKQGVLDAAAGLFGVTFQEESAPAWDPSVETWNVLEGGKPKGRFYLDMHPRPGKYSHAAMFPVLDGVEGKQLPEAILICNLPQPTASDPGLNDYRDVVTFFHEFGHLMHFILAGHQKWAGISGLSMEADFVEAPSQMLEELIRSPSVLSLFARHYKTGEEIPADLVRRMNRAAAFGRGGDVARQTSFSAISYDLYKGDPESSDPDKVTDDDIRRYSLVKLSPETHFWASFGHLSGYSSAYYTYMWDKVIALDFFAQFDQKNPLSGKTPSHYREAVLEPGGSVSANDLVKNFLGRPQNTVAFKEWIGEEFRGEERK